MKKSLLIACVVTVVSTYIYGDTTTRNDVKKTTDNNSVTYERRESVRPGLYNVHRCTKTTVIKNSTKTEEFTCTRNNEPIANSAASKGLFENLESWYNA